MKINNKYEILTPDGFVDFVGVYKVKKNTINIFFDNGLTLRGSFGHIIYDYNNNEIELSKVKCGDKIISHDGFLTVVDIKKIYHKTDVYDVVESGKKHIYYTNNIVSHNCEFLGSGDSVIPSEVQERILKTMIKPPMEKYMSGALWQWKEPIQGHRYILSGDVSRGDSEDYSAISIIDFDEREQVLEYVGKIPPDDLASIMYKWGILYNAFIVVDITGGMGVATSRKLQEMGYKDMFIDGTNVKNVWEYNIKALEKIPGINFNNKRVQIVAAFEEQLRNGFIVRSQRLMNEINTFVYLNGRPDHMKGAHDDAIMALAMALYVGDISFSQLKRNEDINKSMMESWTMSEKSYHPNELFYSYGKDMDSVGQMFMGNTPTPNVTDKNVYSEYSWLFGKKQ